MDNNPDGPVDTRDVFARIAAEARLTAPTKEAVESEQQRTALAAKRAQRLEESGVKDVITPDDFDRIVAGGSSRTEVLPTMAWRTVKTWHECFNGERTGKHVPITVLYGLTGRGKTVAGAWLIAREGGVYVSAPDARRVFQDRPNENRIAQILRARVLLLDDLGTEDNDPKGQATLWEIVNKRLGLRNAMTLITANLALYPKPPHVIEHQAFATRYDERIKRRIDHVGRFVEAVGEDLRRPA